MMSKFHFLSLFFFILGVIFFIMGFFSGEVEVGFFLIFPFLIGSGVHAFLGFIFVFVAIIILMFGFVNRLKTIQEDIEFKGQEHLHSRSKTSVKGGGIILIGPLPIVFGSNWKIALVLMIFAIILIVVTILTFKSTIGL